MALIITKQDAIKVVEKFGLVERTRKERLFKLVYNGVTILATAVPKGRGPLHVTNEFRKQLYLTREQLTSAIDCPFKAPQWLARLQELGILPKDDD
jgi:hypothetical protein